MFTSVVGFFFRFPETAQDAQTFRVVGVLHNTCIGYQHGWYLEAARSNPAVDRNFDIF